MQASTAPKQAADLDQLTLTLGAVMRHLMMATGRGFFQAVEELGLSLSQIKSLQLLSDFEDPVALGSLSEGLGLSLPAVSRAVDGLVKRGLVKRQEDPRDRRSKLVTMTAKGRRTVSDLVALRVAGLRDFLESLEPDQREALATGLEPLARSDQIAALIREVNP